MNSRDLHHIFAMTLLLMIAAAPCAFCAERAVTSAPARESTRLLWTSSGTYIISASGKIERFVKHHWLIEQPHAWLDMRRSSLRHNIEDGEQLELYQYPAADRTPSPNPARIWSWLDALPEVEPSVADEDSEPVDVPLQREHWYQAWRLHPTFIRPPYFSYLQEESGYTGGAHGWSSFTATTLDLRTLRPLRFRELFAAEAWPKVKDAVTTHIASIWDADELEEDDDGRESLVESLKEAGDRSFLLTYGPKGVVVHLVFDECEIHCYALGGVWLAIDLARLPPAVRDALVPEIATAHLALPRGMGLQYPDLQTQSVGVRADPSSQEEALHANRWLIGSQTIHNAIPSGVTKAFRPR